MEQRKNDPIISKVNIIVDKIEEITKEVRSSFNSREALLIVTKLQEAEFWSKQYIAELSDK